ncbi:GDP-mannose 4,6-dehydratase [Blyttiomyces helicus]|uniref:GDP-mannose 4,6-dehydratase n=1 Tax=Blyttiomyces helicus TaxID=388810 RepID=A0A4P9WJA1_9FUNG|nr:GDP-mannose 4,6-dehydratase [Blyttiomyces helicus]|eukprot:RKO92013.1 GDP-mannose 4,6-dehydratase [Blyttiomyces helicus]
MAISSIDTLPASKVALIFGITGQTGSYLTDHLLSLGYKVHGVIRRSSNFTTNRLEHVFDQIRNNLHYGDVTDSLFVMKILGKIKPNEIYNLAAQSHVAVSFELPSYSTNVNCLGTLNILEGIRLCNLERVSKFYQAGTSEMFGGQKEDFTEQEWERIVTKGMTEKTPFHPKSPYGAAKLLSHNLVQIYRKSYNIFASNGICFNHESHRRDPRFVTRKITVSVANIKKGIQEQLVLGNLNAERDWGHAEDYARAIHLCLQQDNPVDVVIATGRTFSVRQLVEIAFAAIDVDIIWKGHGEKEVGIDKKTEKVLVKISPQYYRPNEVHYLKGDSTLAKELIFWEPKWTFEQMITEMVKCDLT